MWLLSSTTGWKDILNKTQEMLRLNFRLIFWYITRINMHCTLPDIFVLQLHRDTLNPLLQQICQIHPYTTLYHHEPITENLYYVNHSCNFQRVNAYYFSVLYFHWYHHDTFSFGCIPWTNGFITPMPYVFMALLTWTMDGSSP